jgi:hypothetical protein
VRIGIGSLRLRDLQKGAVRELSAQEKNELDSAIWGKLEKAKLQSDLRRAAPHGSPKI